MAEKYTNSTSSTSGFRIGSQTPIDDRLYFNSLQELKDTMNSALIGNNVANKVARYYDGMTVEVGLERKKFKWLEINPSIVPARNSVTQTYTYTSGFPTEYAGKTYGFVDCDLANFSIVTNSVTSILGIAADFKSATPVVDLNKAPNSITFFRRGNQLYILNRFFDSSNNLILNNQSISGLLDSDFILINSNVNATAITIPSLGLPQVVIKEYSKQFTAADSGFCTTFEGSPTIDTALFELVTPLDNTSIVTLEAFIISKGYNTVPYEGAFSLLVAEGISSAYEAILCKTAEASTSANSIASFSTNLTAGQAIHGNPLGFYLGTDYTGSLSNLAADPDFSVSVYIKYLEVTI